MTTSPPNDPTLNDAGVDSDISPDQSSRSDFIKGSLQVALTVGVLVLGFAANKVLTSMQSPPTQRASAPSVLFVEVDVPLVRDQGIIIRESGVVQARNAIDLSPQIGGRVVSVSPNLASGGYFRAGEVLFRIDPSDLQATLDRAVADVSSARASLQVERAEAEVAIAEWNLVNPGEPVPPLVAREPQISQAEATVSSASAAEAQARLDLSRVAFSLPFNGRILSTTIEIGQNLNVGQSAGAAYSTSEIEVSVPLASREVGALAPVIGRTATIRTLNNGQTRLLEGQITRNDAEVDSETRMNRVIISFEDAAPLLPGEFVEVEITGPTISNAHFIPEQAISQNRTIWVVKNGRLEARRPRFFSAENGTVMVEAFDFADGIVVSPLINPEEGALIEVEG